MYDIVKKWDWGNAESDQIYHDPETRKNSISFRSNLTRLAEQLTKENKSERAIEILDLTMEKMPLEYFGYYSLLTPVVAAYYQANAKEKAGELAVQIANKYRDKLSYYKSIGDANQQGYAEIILTDTERYRAVVDAAVAAEHFAVAKGLIQGFIESSRTFAPLYSAYDYYAPMAPYVSVLLDTEMEESGRLLFDAIAQVYQNRLALFSQVPDEELAYYKESIAYEVSGYQKLVESYQMVEPDLAIVSKVNKAFRKAVAPYQQN
jgi:hypothetical protein